MLFPLLLRMNLVKGSECHTKKSAELFIEAAILWDSLFLVPLNDLSIL